MECLIDCFQCLSFQSLSEKGDHLGPLKSLWVEKNYYFLQYHHFLHKILLFCSQFRTHYRNVKFTIYYSKKV
jgi:hypothetical protein